MLFLFVLGTASSAYAQQEPTLNTKVSTPADTIAQDTILPKVNTFKTIFNGKPGKAALYSLIVPSGGQIYNKKWWKVPLALGIDGFFLYNLTAIKSDYNKFNTIVNNYSKGIKDPTYSLSQAINIRKQARTGVENAWVCLFIGHLVTVFDAYVDRHLMDFDISPDLSINHTATYPNALSSITIFSVKYNIH